MNWKNSAALWKDDDVHCDLADNTVQFRLDKATKLHNLSNDFS